MPKRLHQIENFTILSQKCFRFPVIKILRLDKCDKCPRLIMQGIIGSVNNEGHYDNTEQLPY